ncbi:MAG: hypothetical protein HY537_09865, partial [Deltaproteobacteria bacterium]|nr:hypothetical protein [Deltaproteobacteria bacterium]
MSAITEQSTPHLVKLAAWSTVLAAAVTTLYVLSIVGTDTTGMYRLYLLMLIQAMPFLVSFAKEKVNFLSIIFANHLITYSVAKLNQAHTYFKVQYLFPTAINAINELIICYLIIFGSYTVAKKLIFATPLSNEKIKYFH